MTLTGFNFGAVGSGASVNCVYGPYTAARCAVTVSHSDEGRSTFQIVFRALREFPTGLVDYPILITQRVKVGTRVVLILTVNAIPQDVFIAFSEPGPDLADGLLDVERWTEMLREVGFASSPETAQEFVRSFIADRTVRRR